MSLADALAFPPAPVSSAFPVIDPALLDEPQDVHMQQAEEYQEEPELKEEAEDHEMGDLFGDEAYVASQHVSLLYYNWVL